LPQALDIAKAAEGDGPEAPPKPRLPEQPRQALPSRHYSPGTEPTYCDWVKRFIFYHQVRQPSRRPTARLCVTGTEEGYAMSDAVEFVETASAPVCPHCGTTLARIEYLRQKLSFGFMRGFSWTVLLLCPHCHKVLGTQNW
jgi:predicted RNA-binding Zn-ribbon protein involved in translation (DUF1610 family)